MVAQALRRPAAAGEAMVLPAGFVAGLVVPIFATNERARRAVGLIGAPLAHACARAVQPALDPEALKAGAQAQAILGKAPRERVVKLCAALANAGIETVALKGLATAYALYPRPCLRLLPDADILVRPADLEGLVARLKAWGFASVIAPATVRRWGALTAASFAPVTPPDRRYLIDVHVAVDDAPASLGLTTEAVFARSRPLATPAGTLRVPAPEHAWCILALHAFRDFYEPRGLKSLVDAALLLAGRGAGLDWGLIERTARAGRFVRRAVFYRDLLAALGMACPRPFRGIGLGRVEHWLLARAAANFRSLARPCASDAVKLACEALLLDSPLETVRWNGRRLAGLVRPRSHALAGLPRV